MHPWNFEGEIVEGKWKVKKVLRKKEEENGIANRGECGVERSPRINF